MGAWWFSLVVSVACRLLLGEWVLHAGDLQVEEPQDGVAETLPSMPEACRCVDRSIKRQLLLNLSAKGLSTAYRLSDILSTFNDKPGSCNP